MMVALIKVDSPPKLEGARAWQVQSRALGETGHGARGGRTGDSGSLGGLWAAMRCAGLSSRGLSTPAAQQQHQPRLLCFPTAKDGLHTHTCTSLEDILAIPPPSRRPWRRSAPGPAPEVTQRDKRAVGLLQPCRNIHSSSPLQERKKKKIQ